MFRNRSLILKFCFFTQPTPIKLIKDSQKIGVSTITPDPYYSNNQYMIATQATKKNIQRNRWTNQCTCVAKNPTIFTCWSAPRPSTSFFSRTRLASTVEKRTPSMPTSERQQKQSSKADIHNMTCYSSPCVFSSIFHLLHHRCR